MITKFNTAHVKSQATKIANKPLTVWSDGTYIIIAAGEGADGAAVGQRVAAACSLPVEVKSSKLLGSIAELNAKAANGIVDQTFVLISR